jgi:hypothetical protein
VERRKEGSRLFVVPATISQMEKRAVKMLFRKCHASCFTSNHGIEHIFYDLTLSPQHLLLMLLHAADVRMCTNVYICSEASKVAKRV